MKRIVVKEPGKPLKIETVDMKYVCELKKFIGTDDTICEKLQINEGGIFLVVDEEGWPKGYDFNFYTPSTSQLFPIQKIVGNACFVRIKPLNIEEDPYDYEIETLTTADIVFYILPIFRKQSVLKEIFHELFPDEKTYLKPVFIPMDC